MEEVSLRHAEVSKALGNGWRWCETWEPGISLAWKIGLVLCWWWSVQRQRVTGIWICAGIFTCWCAYFEEEGEQKAPRKVWERSEKWMGEILEYLRRREWVSASLDAYRNVSHRFQDRRRLQSQTQDVSIRPLLVAKSRQRRKRSFIWEFGAISIIGEYFMHVCISVSVACLYEQPLNFCGGSLRLKKSLRSPE